MTNQYEEKDELCHEPDGDPWWQESFVVTWWDEAAGFGGFARIGHEAGQGTSTVWLGAVTDAGERFRYCESALPLTDADRSGDGFSAGDGTSTVAGAVLENGRLRWRLDRPELSADLTLADFYPMTNPLTLGQNSSLATEFAPQHWEASGRLTGTVRLGTGTYDLDALYHRDHSWGIRRWETLLTHRWVAGTTGRELSFLALTWYSADGRLVREGFVNRGGETVPATGVDVVAGVEPDGISCRGGTVRLELADGSTVGLECTAVDGIVSLHRNMACVDTISRVRTDSGRTGFCDFETTHNSRNGSGPVHLAVAAALEDGLTRR